MCFARGDWESRDVQLAIMCGFDGLSVGESDANWILGRDNVYGGGLWHEKMSRCARVGNGSSGVDTYCISCTCYVFCCGAGAIACFDCFFVVLYVYFCARVVTTVCVGGNKFC